MQNERLHPRSRITRLLALVLCPIGLAISAACDPDALIKSQPQTGAENERALGLMSQSGSAERSKGTPDDFARRSELSTQVRDHLVYVWRDRHSCSGVLALIPETEPPVEVVLTAGHCIAANPLRRSGGIKSPAFRMVKLSAHKHPRIDPFLASYFFRNEAVDTTAYDVEMIAEPTAAVPKPWEFDNDDRLLALYHDDFPIKAFVPTKGAVHKDYFSLFRKVSTQQGDGYVNILNHFDLALIPLSPRPAFINQRRAPFRIRPLPKPQPGDKTYRAILSRDNVAQKLAFEMTPIEVTGFSRDHALIQGCETPPEQTKDFKSDAGSALLLERAGEIYLIGIAAFGNPSPAIIHGQQCALTTFTHLAAYTGWMKITASQFSAP